MIDSRFTIHDSRLTSEYRAPWWLPGGHAQTVYASLFTPRPRVTLRRERWETPDGDFIDLDWVAEPAPHDGNRGQTTFSASSPQNATPGGKGGLSPISHALPLVVLFHGLEGSSRSHYAVALMAAVRDAGWRGAVVHFRGCSGEMNRLPRAYHSGDSAEIDWIARRLRREQADAPLFAAGVSLGGNALLKWLGESGASASGIVDRAAAVSAPLDLMVSGDALGRGINLLYARHFLRTLKPKGLAKLKRFPGLFDVARLRAAWTLRQFDDCVTAPLHGYRDTDDYWTRASSKPGLAGIRVPTLVINARNDPFLPAAALPGGRQVSAAVTLEQPEGGGHAGFVSGSFPGDLGWLPRRVLGYFGAPAQVR